MPDREKVIAQCEWAIKQTSPIIIESKTFYEETLALLKEQERIIKQYQKADGFLFTHEWKWEGW